jgi:TatD DNase family protein
VSSDDIRWIDSHCHLTAPEFEDDRDQALQRARQAGVDVLMVIGSGYGLDDVAAASALAEREPDIYASAGVHPHDARLWCPDAADRVAAALDDPQVMAVGECGLDYWYENSPRDEQRRALADQLALARERDLPVSLHVRDREDDAYEELLELWRSEGGGHLQGVLHCYTHSEAYARRALDLGLLVSFSGILTFKRDRGLRDVARALPLSHLMVETDAPLLAPEGHRGRRNEPARVVQVGQVLAAVQERPLEEVAAATSANARRLFRLPD